MAPLGEDGYVGFVHDDWSTTVSTCRHGRSGVCSGSMPALHPNPTVRRACGATQDLDHAA